jgi:hypothetical protein
MQQAHKTARHFAAILLLVVFAAGVLAGIFGTEFLEHAEDTDALLQVTAAQLADGYSTDDTGADRQYRSRLVEITGIVDEVSTDSLDRRVVELAGIALADDSRTDVKCIFADTIEDTYAIRAGDQVTVVGTCVGKGGDVLVTDCRLE